MNYFEKNLIEWIWNMGWVSKLLRFENDVISSVTEDTVKYSEIVTYIQLIGTKLLYRFGRVS